MSIQIVGASGYVSEVERYTKAQRVVQRAADVGALGSYAASVVTGTVGAGMAAGSEIAQFRWNDATRLCLLREIRFDGLGSVAAFAAGVVWFRAIIARAWTAAGTGGTTAAMGTNNSNKMRTSQALSLISGAAGEIRYATTAALTAGTKQLDNSAVGSIVAGIASTAGAGVQQAKLFDGLEGGRHPIVLGYQEGIAIVGTVPATGTWTAGITFVWDEVTDY